MLPLKSQLPKSTHRSVEALERSKSTSPCKMPQFLTVPLEIRNAVYELCLVRGKVFPYTVTEENEERQFVKGEKDPMMKFHGYTAPDVNILSVCKATYHEAAPILYGKNTFVLPTCGLTTRFFETALKTPIQQSWISSVEIRFQHEDMTIKEENLAHLLAKNEFSFMQAGNGPWMPPGNNLSVSILYLINVVWKEKLDPILDLLYLDNLVIDLGGSLWRNRGMRDLNRYVLDLFKKGFARGVPKSFTIKHKMTMALVKDSDEDRRFFEYWSRERQMKEARDQQMAVQQT